MLPLCCDDVVAHTKMLPPRLLTLHADSAIIRCFDAVTIHTRTRHVLPQHCYADIITPCYDATPPPRLARQAPTPRHAIITLCRYAAASPAAAMLRC